jgi:ketosteroid isomerase-like protein
MAEIWASGGVDAYVDHLAHVAAPDIVWREDPGWPDRAVVTGIDAIRELLIDRVESTAFGITIDELVDGGDRVLALLRWTAHGRSSGAEADLEVAIVTTFSSGKVSEVDFFLDRGAARRAFES